MTRCCWKRPAREVKILVASLRAAGGAISKLLEVHGSSCKHTACCLVLSIPGSFSVWFFFFFFFPPFYQGLVCPNVALPPSRAVRFLPVALPFSCPSLTGLLTHGASQRKVPRPSSVLILLIHLVLQTRCPSFLPLWFPVLCLSHIYLFVYRHQIFQGIPIWDRPGGQLGRAVGPARRAWGARGKAAGGRQEPRLLKQWYLLLFLPVGCLTAAWDGL